MIPAIIQLFTRHQTNRRFVLSWVALLFSLWFALPLAAQTIEPAAATAWTRTNPGGGGAFTAVGAGPTGLMVVGSDLSGAYISRDQGQHWEPIGATQGLRGRFADNVAAVAFDPQDGNIFYLGTPDGIYRTGDGGRQFQRLNTEQPVIDDVNGEVYTVNGVILDIAIAPINPNVGYAAWHPYSMAWKEGINARQGQVFRTNDRGLTWAKVSNASLPNTLRLIELIVHPTNPELLYALSGASREATGDIALYRSSDGGRNWSRLAANIDRIHDVAFDKRNPNTLYLTTADFLDANHAPWDCPSPATTGKFYRSDNGGDTWAKLADRGGRIWVDGDDQFAVRLLQPDHQNNWADGCSGLWESIDRGVTWQRVADQRNWGRGWYGFDTGYRWSFEPARTLGEDLSNPDRLLWIDDGFVYATADDGRTFQNLHSVEVAPGRWQSRGVDNVVMLDMALGASNNSNGSDVYLAYYDIGCWHSADGGTSWAHCSLPDPNFTDGRKGWDNFTTLVADPTRVGVVWAAHAWDRDDPQTHALLRSEDAGKNWQIITSDAGVMSGLALDVNSPVNNRTLFVTIGEDLYRSQDDGHTWQKVYDCNGCWFTAVDRVNRSLVYAGGEAGFFRSTQGGATGSWRKVNFADFAGRDGNPWWWGDAQDGWQGIHDIVVDPVRLGWVYATVFRYFDPDQPDQPQGGLYRSQDGGVTWQQLLPNNYRHYLRDIAISPLDSRILFVTSSSSNCCGGDPMHSHGVLRSVDGGATWAQFNEGMAWPHARSVAIDPKNPALVWVGSPGTGFQKRTFADLPQPTPTATPVANLIRNGDFSQGVDPWHGGTDTTDLTVRNGELCLDIPTTVTEPAAAQMGQYGLSLENGQRYQVSFNMVSNANATVTLILGTSEPPWVHYFAPPVPLTTARQAFNFTFTMQQATDRNALFTFHLGGNSASVICLDNVVVQKISGTAPTATSTPTASPTPTAPPTATPTPTTPPPALNSINGRLTDESNGQPLHGVTVTAYRFTGSKWAKTATTQSAANGAYQVTNLPAGDYRLLFKLRRYKSEYYDNARKLSLARTITLIPGQTVSGIDGALLSSNLISSAQTTAAATGNFQIQLVVTQSDLAEEDALITLYQVPGWRPRHDPTDNTEATCESLASVGSPGSWSQLAPTVLAAWHDEGVGSDAIDWQVAPGCWYVTVENEEGAVNIGPLIGVNDTPVRVTLPIPAPVRVYLPWIIR